MKPYALTVDSLEVSYRRRNTKCQKGFASPRSRFEHVSALKDISFKCREGEIIGIVGSNGAGKSTLLSSLAHQIRFDGEIRSRAVPRLLTLSPKLPLSFTGRQHCDLMISSTFRDRKRCLDYADEALDFSELGDAVDAPMSTYSKGMRTRLIFSTLTVGQPEILLVDEALAVGDRRFLKKAARRIKRLADGSSTVMICDHSPTRLKAMCQRGILLERGRLLDDGPIKTILEGYQDVSRR